MILSFWDIFILGFFVGVFAGIFAMGVIQMVRGHDTQVVRQHPPMDESPRPAATPNPPPRVVKR